MAEESADGKRADEEESVQGSLEGATQKGEVRLQRSAVTLLANGTIAGIDVGFGVLAMLGVTEATGSEMLGALAFSIGFIAMLLGRSELFTENMLIPVTAALRRHRSFGSLLRLWGLTGLGNLAGGWLIMAIIVVAVPRIRESDALIDAGNHFIEMGITWEMFASALLGGAVMTLMTWMEQNTGSVVAKLVAVVSASFVLASTPLFHAVVSTLEIFGALQAGAPFGYLDWLGAFAIAVIGNIVGGVGLVTVQRIVQARGESGPGAQVPTP